MRTSVLRRAVVAIGLGLLVAGGPIRPAAYQLPTGAVSIDGDDIGGVVTSTNGPEAGVWVIAETTELSTRFIKVVVTDDRGRYLLPDLPPTTYHVWVRGYGLVDSPKVVEKPGRVVNLRAFLEPNARAAAEYYPPNYWYSLLQIPPKSDFPGTGAKGNGIAETMKYQDEWKGLIGANGCEGCHQMGTKATREIPQELRTLNSVAAWERRLQAGRSGTAHMAMLDQFGRQRALAMFADWTDRIAKGEVPPPPPRPQGVERNVVLTQWFWSDYKGYTHDAASTDRRDPTVNAYGPVYSAEQNTSDSLNILDPIRHTTRRVPIPLPPTLPPPTPAKLLQPSLYYGDKALAVGQTGAHSPILDQKGRVWITLLGNIRTDNPAFCKQGSNHPSAQRFPLDTNGRQLGLYDPKSDKFTIIDTCFGMHHPEFAEDVNDTLWVSGDPRALGWFNTRMFDETGDSVASQGWLPYVLDTNGNGKLDAYVAVDQPIDPTKDRQILGSNYMVIPNHLDGSVWVTLCCNSLPGRIVRVDPVTGLSEVYEPPFNNPKAPASAYNPRGIEIDRNGVIWTGGSASGHLLSFDRRKCKGPLNGPTAMGQHCPEGWTLYPTPGPRFKGMTEGTGNADFHYQLWVDQFNTSGLGSNVPFANGSGSDSLLALRPDGQFTVIRVPYPIGFYTRGWDGRIDDPKAGWKGRGLWATTAVFTPWHTEGGKGTTSRAVQMQVRPDPLAK